MKRLLLAFFFVGLLVACGDEQAPQSPLDDGPIFPPEPQPTDFFVAFQAGLQTETAALCDRFLSDDFVFSPTPEDSLLDDFAGTGVFAAWTRPVEVSVLTPLFHDAASIDVEFSPVVEINQNVFARYRVAYILAITTTTGTAVEYRGVARFDIRNEMGPWRLVRWDEIENVDGYASWGFLRGTLRPRLYYPGKG